MSMHMDKARIDNTIARADHVTPSRQRVRHSSSPAQLRSATTSHRQPTVLQQRATRSSRALLPKAITLTAAVVACGLASICGARLGLGSGINATASRWSQGVASHLAVRSAKPASSIAWLSSSLLAPLRDLHQIPYSSRRSMATKAGSAPANAPGWDPKKTPFPTARRTDDSFTYKSKAKGSVTVPEPYFWLETPSSQSKETKEWVDAQAAFTEQYAKGCTDRDELKKRLRANIDYARYSAPARTGREPNPEEGRYVYSYNSGLDPQATYYSASKADLDHAQQEGYKQPPGVKWFDQNLLSEDGTIALSGVAFSKSAQYAAYGVSKSGSDWSTWHFRQTNKPFDAPAKTPEDAAQGGPDRLPDKLERIKYSSVTWTHDDKGVFYQRYPAAKHSGDGTETDLSKDAALYYHRLGTEQKDDVLVISADKTCATSMWGTEVSTDGKWLIVTHSIDTDTKSRTYVASLEQKIGPNMKWICLVPSFKYQLNFVVNVGEDLYFLTNKDAPNYKLVRIRVAANEAEQVEHVTEMTGEASAEDIVEEDKGAPIADATVVNKDKLLLVYSRDVKSELWQVELTKGAKVARLLPDFVGTINTVTGRPHDNEAFVGTMAFVNPGIVYRLTWAADGADDATVQPSVAQHRATKVKGIDPSQYESKQVFVTSKDGTKVPVFLTYRKDTKFDGTAPAWLYFYGGFGISMNPTFSASLMTWIGAYGGVLAWVNARGGAEYGDAWHDAGRLLRKTNVFDDVLSAAQYLVDERVAGEGKIIVNGGSNGGMGAMAVGNRAPEGLLGGVVAEVGVHDMLRFMHFTAGKFWTADYGNPSEDPEMFDYVYDYSPLHAIDDSKVYPTTLLMSGDHDDRVSPLHTFKMAAELQHRLPSNANPLLARLELKAGHGAGKSTQKMIEEAADKYSITARALGLELKPLPSDAKM